MVMMVGDLLGMSLTIDNVQPSPFTQWLAHWQTDHCRHLHGFFRTGFLRRRDRVRTFSPETGHRRVADAGVLHSRGRKSGHHLCRPRSPANLVITPSLPLAGFIFTGRSDDRLDVGWLRLAHAAATLVYVGLRARRGFIFRLRLGFGEGASVQPRNIQLNRNTRRESLGRSAGLRHSSMAHILKRALPEAIVPSRWGASFVVANVKIRTLWRSAWGEDPIETPPLECHL